MHIARYTSTHFFMCCKFLNHKGNTTVIDITADRYAIEATGNSDISKAAVQDTKSTLVLKMYCMN